MSARRLLTIAAIALAWATVGCGTSGSGTARPVETLIYVQGGTGTPFMFVDSPDPACGSTGTGIEAPKTSHQFGNRVFLTPHLFVLENVRQPVRAVIRNLAAPGQPSLTVDLFLGLNAQVSDFEIAPGTCGTLISSTAAPLNVNPVGPAVQVDICAPLDATNNLDVRIPCVGDTTDPPDRSVSFFASIGDIEASNITSCTLTGVLDSCRSPATFFIEQPQDRVDAVMQVNTGQNPGTGSPPEIRVELSINGQNVDADAGTNPVVGHEF